jgi:hypothetical protein
MGERGRQRGILAIVTLALASALVVGCGKTTDDQQGSIGEGGLEDSGGGTPIGAGGTTGAGGGTPIGPGGATGGSPTEANAGAGQDGGACFSPVSGRSDSEPPPSGCPCISKTSRSYEPSCENEGDVCRYQTHIRCWVDHCLCVNNAKGALVWECLPNLC